MEAWNGKIKGSGFVPCKRPSECASATALKVAILLLVIYSDYSKPHPRPLNVSEPRRQSRPEITGGQLRRMIEEDVFCVNTRTVWLLRLRLSGDKREILKLLRCFSHTHTLLCVRERLFAQLWSSS